MRLLCLLVLWSASLLAAIPVDISFMVVDLKYGAEKGVQICEIQPGTYSRFKGIDDITGSEGEASRLFLEALKKYTSRVWYVGMDITDPNIRSDVKSDPNWKGFIDMKALINSSDFIYYAKNAPKNKHSISDYKGMVYVRSKRVDDCETFYANYPGVILADAPFFPYASDKYFMNQAMAKVPEARRIKPKWGLYGKHYTQELTGRILKDIDSEIVVIKPRRGSRGRGVIIVPREELDATLQLILGKKDRVRNHSDLAIKYWASDMLDSFLVEEFAESDPICSPKLGGALYDGTVRALLLMTYSDGEAKLEWLGGYWKLPEKSLNSTATFTEKHRSIAEKNYFLEIDSGTQEAIMRELDRGLTPLYRFMIST